MRMPYCDRSRIQMCTKLKVQVLEANTLLLKSDGPVTFR